MADQILEITIPDAYVQKAIDSFTIASGKEIRIVIEETGSNFCADWNFTVAEQQAGETLKDFGKRFLRSMGIAVIKAIDMKEDRDRYTTEVQSLTIPSCDVPDDILT